METKRESSWYSAINLFSICIYRAVVTRNKYFCTWWSNVFFLSSTKFRKYVLCTEFLLNTKPVIRIIIYYIKKSIKPDNLWRLMTEMSYFTFDVFEKWCTRPSTLVFPILTFAQDNPIVETHINVRNIGYDR